jgi:YidC/Oxa1 family membrane protein insertase
LNTKRFIGFLAIGMAVVLAVQFIMPGGKKSTPQSDATTQPAATQPTSEPEAKRPSPRPSEPTADTQPDASPDASPAPSRWQIFTGRAGTVSLGSLAGYAASDQPRDERFLLELVTTSRGAAIESVKLADYFQTVADKQLYEDNPEQYQVLAAKDPEEYQGHYAVLEPVHYKGMSYYPLSTDRVTVWIGDASEPVVFNAVEAGRPLRWVKVDESRTETTQSVTWQWAIYGVSGEGETVQRTRMLVLNKTYTIRRGSYSIGVSMTMRNVSGQPLRVRVNQSGPVGIGREDSRSDQRMLVVGKVEQSTIEPVQYQNDALYETTYGEWKDLGSSNANELPVAWVAYVNKFFGAILYLKPGMSDQLAAGDTDADYAARPVQQTPTERTWQTAVTLREIALPPAGQTRAERQVSFDLFAGPKIRQMLTTQPLYTRLRYVETISAGGCTFCTFDWLRDGLMWLLTVFASYLFFGNYGLAIILLVVIVRVILHPLTKYGQVSMSKMQKQMASLQPQMQKLREKYADNKQKLNEEMMKLYRTHGNPMAGMLGCLPMFLQLPIWVALYSGLNTNVLLRHAELLPFWINDLAAPDQLITWSYDLPLIGHAFNLLPILLVVTMFLQQKYMSPPSAATSPEQQQQQKMMRIMLPVMMLFFFYKAPSGLTLYIMASSGIGLLEQKRIRKHIEEKDEQTAIQGTVIDAPGKAPRDSRPKKPKGPFWIKRG